MCPPRYHRQCPDWVPRGVELGSVGGKVGLFALHSGCTVALVAYIQARFGGFRRGHCPSLDPRPGVVWAVPGSARVRVDCLDLGAIGAPTRD